jgi:signal transduction histidine kinase
LAIHLHLLDEDLSALPGGEHSRRRVELLRAEVDRLAAMLSPAAERPSSVDLNRALADLYGLLSPEFSAAGLALRAEPSPMPVRAWCDGDGLRAAALNLLTNAREATPAGGTVTVRAAHGPEGEALLEVIDTGPGLPADPPIGDSTKGPGRGLGLPSVRQFAERWGGRLILGAGPHGGTRAVLRLPTARTT